MLSMRCYLMNLIVLSFADLTQISACYFDLYLIDIFVYIYIAQTTHNKAASICSSKLWLLICGLFIVAIY